MSVMFAQGISACGTGHSGEGRSFWFYFYFPSFFFFLFWGGWGVMGGVAFGWDAFSVSHFLLLFFFLQIVLNCPGCFPGSGTALWALCALAPSPAAGHSAGELLHSLFLPPGDQEAARPQRKIQPANTQAANLPLPNGFEKKLKFCSFLRYIQINWVFFGSSI